MRFKQFISEASVTGDDGPKFHPHDVDEGINILKTHCGDALWMVKENLPLYRGSKLDGEYSKDFYTADPTLTARKSQNTTNHYTVLMDNLPSYKGWPKRSRSFVASTDHYYASSYAPWTGSPGAGGRIVIPFDGVKIGVCPRNDIWHTPIFKTVNFSSLGALFNHIGLKGDSWEDFLTFAKKIKTEDDMTWATHARWWLDNGDRKAATHPLMDESQIENIRQDFIKFLDEEFNPTRLGFKRYTTKNFKAARTKLIHNEAWIGGKCMFIQPSVWPWLQEAI